MDWLDFIDAMLPNGLQIDDNEIVNNAVPKFLERLGEVMNSTSKRTMANYMFWRVLYSVSAALTEQIRSPNSYWGNEKRWKECVSITVFRYIIKLSSRRITDSGN